MCQCTSIPHIFDKFLLRELLNITKSDHILEQAVQEIVQNHGVLTIRSLIRDLNISERRLERLFDRHIGISPERFAKMLRLNTFIRLANQPNRPSFTQLAYECGYTDQSHLIRAFKQYTGLIHRDYFSQKHQIQQKLNQESF